ncbi:MAG: hypothetical protein WC889_14215 [Myxococcota bacterium]
MKSAAKTIDPSDYILSVLTPQQKLDAAMKLSQEAFKNVTLTLKDVEDAVKAIRRKTNVRKK